MCTGKKRTISIFQITHVLTHNCIDAKHTEYINALGHKKKCSQTFCSRQKEVSRPFADYLWSLLPEVSLFSLTRKQPLTTDPYYPF